jgi:hypothetical protein
MTFAFADPARAARAVLLIANIGLSLSSLEWLLPRGKLAANDLFQPCLSPATERAWQSFQRFWRPSGLRALLWLRLSASLCGVAACLQGSLGWCGLSCSCAAALSLVLRLDEPIGLYLGMDGAEHQLTLALLTLGVALLLGSPFALEAALGLVALSALLEYASAGWVKLLKWRAWARGSNLLRVLSSSNFGHPWLAARGREHPRVVGALSMAVIALEIGMPATLLLPAPFAECLLALVLGFHLGCAVIMGFGTFVWAFAATFPAILLCRDWLRALFS